MEAYGAVLNWVIPVFLFLYFIEVVVAWRKGLKVIRSIDSISSFSSGITNVVKDVLGLSIGILSYPWMVEHFALVHVEATWLTYVIGFIAVDFQGYWVHRWSHEINFLWNRHIIHHSSEEFNLSCALRQSISNIFNYFTILLLPAALLGVPASVIAVIGPVHLFLQYWYHTQLIGKLGWLEHILVTPSHHRVHHAINPEYLDRNYAQIFIVWDKWFGTFQEELPHVPPVYGVKRPVRTWNPFKINFQHFWLLLSDAWRTRSWWDKLRLWFMPTGWRPADVQARYPVPVVEDVYRLEKYNPPASHALVVWSWGQMFFCYFLLIYFFAYLGQIGSPAIFWYGAFVFASVYAYTELMDLHPYAPWYELAKSLLGFYLLAEGGGDWFGAAERVGSWYVGLVAVHLAVSPVVAFWIASREIWKRRTARTTISSTL
ncbi:MAG: sterol desaturase family protein [Saprospiraceae bacterium]|nr:sterol desaturase family protein [Saprospiraceae bacterium]MDW8483581.1 sterol desaturase family protein [Saprospiraceae bacterium]